MPQVVADLLEGKAISKKPRCAGMPQRMRSRVSGLDAKCDKLAIGNVVGAMLLPQSVTLRRLSSSCTFDQSGNRFVEPSWKPAGVNSSPSNSASPISGGIGHVIPATLARLTYSETAVLPTPVASRTSRTLSPSSCVSRSTSRIFLIDTLTLAIGSPCCSSQGLPIY
jgi:hypothetical protein